MSKSLSCEVGERVGCQDKDVYRALCTPPIFVLCIRLRRSGGIPRAVDARRTREYVVGARCFAGIRSIHTCHRFSSCFSGSLVLAGAAAAREAVAFSLPASPEVVAPGACMTGAGFWNVSPGLAIPVAIPLRYAFPWCVANTPLSPDPFMLVEVMSQARLRSLRMGRRGEDVQRVPKFRAPRRERKRGRCRVRREFTHLERKRSLHRRRCGQSAAVARGSMWSSPTRGRESYGTQTLLVLAHSCCTPSSSVPRQLFQNPTVYNSSNRKYLGFTTPQSLCALFRFPFTTPEKFSLETTSTRLQLPFKQPDGALHNARPSTRCGGSSAVKSVSIHEHVGGGEGRGSSGRRCRRGREEEARFGRRGRRSRGRGSARDGEGESGHVGV